MNMSDVIRDRRSIRKYKPGEPVSEDDIKIILEAAMMAPSACNTRPWEFVVLKSDGAKQKALEAHPRAKQLASASIGILVCARPDIQSGGPADGFFPQDCGAAIENILLQSLELGYGSCWCGIYPRMERVELFQKAFGLTSTPMALVVIGVADESPAAKGFYDEDKVTVL